MGISQLLPPLQGHTMFHFKSTHDDEKKEDAYETTVPVSVSPPQSALQQEIHHHNNRPWYAAGGMDVNMIGIGINISAPVIFLACDLTDDYRKLFLCFLLCMYTAAALTSHTLYCIIVVPTFMSSLLLVLAVSRHHPAIVMTVTIILAIAKVNICMSVCLHRYASHAAFKCGPVAHLFLSVMACLANQGGPLWWASQHRCHHKYVSFCTSYLSGRYLCTIL